MIWYNSLSECSVSSQNNISRYSVSTLTYVAAYWNAMSIPRSILLGCMGKHGEREFVIRAVTPSGGKWMIQYFSLIHHAILLVMEGQGWYSAAQHAYRTRLLAKYKLVKNKSGAWPHRKITQAWHVTSLPFIKSKLSLVHLCQITIGIFKSISPCSLKAQSWGTMWWIVLGIMG